MILSWCVPRMKRLWWRKPNREELDMYTSNIVKRAVGKSFRGPSQQTSSSLLRSKSKKGFQPPMNFGKTDHFQYKTFFCCGNSVVAFSSISMWKKAPGWFYFTYKHENTDNDIVLYSKKGSGANTYGTY